jgi:hypothetical protein
LWKLSSQNQLPPKLDESTILFYQQHFSNAGAIVSSMRGILKNNAPAIDTILANVTSSATVYLMKRAAQFLGIYGEFQRTTSSLCTAWWRPLGC